MEALLEVSHREQLLKVLSVLPMAKTTQLGMCFPSHLSPAKTASKHLKRLEKEKYVEGQRLPNMEKVWRMTHKARKELGTKTLPTPLTSLKVNHYLAFTDVYFALGQPQIFDVELREKFQHEGKPDQYSPDILSIWQKKAVLIEVQLKSLSVKEWAEKWEKANRYFNEGFYKEASWNKYGKGQSIIPHIVVITPQNPENVREGFNVEGRGLTVLKSIPLLCI